MTMFFENSETKRRTRVIGILANGFIELSSKPGVLIREKFDIEHFKTTGKILIRLSIPFKDVEGTLVQE